MSKDLPLEVGSPESFGWLTTDYKQVTPEIFSIKCPECAGTGVFLLPDDEGVPCNYCKTKGEVFV